MKFAFGGHNLFGGSTSSEAVELVKLGEKHGYDIAWFSDNIRDPYAVMSAAAAETKKIGLGVGVTDPFKRHPLITARSIATVDELSNRRAILGLATGDYFEALQFLGITEEEWRKTAYRRVREVVGVIRALLEGKVVKSGEFYKFPDVSLLVGQPRALPIYIAGSGPRILEVAGEVADGVILWPAEPKLLTKALEYVKRGAQRAGRDFKSLDIVARIHVIITSERKKYVDVLRPSAALKLILSNKALFEQYEGYDELHDRLKKTYHVDSHGGPHTNLSVESSYAKEAQRTIPDGVVELFDVVGDSNYCLSRLEDLAKAGVTQLSVIPIPTADFDEKKENLTILAKKMIGRL